MNAEFTKNFEPSLREQLDEISAVEIPKGTIILKEESYIKEIPVVIKGNIKVRKMDESGKEIVLYHIHPGESCILSITFCINDKQSKAEAITEEDSTVAVIPASKVKGWMDEHKSWRKFVMQLYYSRLDTLLTLVDSIAFKQTDIRMVEKLKKLQAKHGDVIKTTHKELANEIGTAREVVSRLLKQLEKDGIISLDRGIIKIIKAL